MPIYEFRCKSCKKIFEELVRSRDQEIVCPECKSREVEKLISTFASVGGESSGDSSCSGCTSSNCSHCH
jgi:putative FmdB family regulatory protein